MNYEGNGHIANIIPDCVTDGEGVRVSVYVAGCTLHCPGCFNASAWNFKAGELFTTQILSQIINDLKPDYIQGLSVLGGEPLQNLAVVRPLIEAIRKEFGNTKDIWLWSGYMKEYISHDQQLRWILNEIDVLIDGPFIEKLKDNDLYFRGSYNQRIQHLNI